MALPKYLVQVMDPFNTLYHVSGYSTVTVMSIRKTTHDIVYSHTMVYFLHEHVCPLGTHLTLHGYALLYRSTINVLQLSMSKG